MAVIADYILPSGAHITIHDDYMAQTQTDRAKALEKYNRMAYSALESSLQSGATAAQLTERIKQANSAANLRRDSISAWRAQHPEYMWGEDEQSKTKNKAP